MKHKKLIISLASLAFLSTACGTKEQKEAEKVDEITQIQNKMHTMPDYELTDTATLAGHIYEYAINRRMDENAPMVIDEMGDYYADNYIELKIQKDGAEYFSHRFTKNTFEANLETEFLESSILDGIRFLKAEQGTGLQFCITVSIPDSDMSRPFLVTVSDDGTFSVVKDDSLNGDE